MNEQQDISSASAGRTDLGTISLALGVAGLLPILPLVGSVGAIACGHAALRDLNRDDQRARTGLVLGWVGLVAPAVVLVIYCVVLGYPFPIHRYQPSN